jgi:hypothetical protein
MKQVEGHILTAAAAAGKLVCYYTDMFTGLSDVRLGQRVADSPCNKTYVELGTPVKNEEGKAVDLKPCMELRLKNTEEGVHVDYLPRTGIVFPVVDELPRPVLDEEADFKVQMVPFCHCITDKLNTYGAPLATTGMRGMQLKEDWGYLKQLGEVMSLGTHLLDVITERKVGTPPKLERAVPVLHLSLSRVQEIVSAFEKPPKEIDHMQLDSVSDDEGAGAAGEAAGAAGMMEVNEPASPPN